MLTIFINKTETMTLPCRVRVLLRNLISHPSYFLYRHQILMACPVEWIMDPPEHEWELDMTTNMIVATTTTVMRTYIHLGHVHEGAD